MNSKNILLCGAHQTNNFGDTLLAFLFAREILSAGHQLHVPFANPELRNQLARLGWKNTPPPKRFDALIYHGGGYFGEPSRKASKRWGRRMLKRYIFPNLKSILTGSPYAILGVGVGPLSYFPARWAVKKLASSATITSVRDEESKNFLRQYGVQQPVHVFPDAALSIGINHSFNQKTSNSFLTGIHLSSIPTIDGSEQQFLEELQKTIACCHLDTISFMDHEGMDAFQQRCIEIANRIGPGSCEVRPPYTDMEEMLNFIDSLDLLITDKLHVGICAVALGKRVISIPKHQKTQRFYRQLGVSNWLLDRNNLQPNEFFENVSEAVKTIGQPISSIQDAMHNAAGHIELLKKFLNEITAVS